MTERFYIFRRLRLKTPQRFGGYICLRLRMDRTRSTQMGPLQMVSLRIWIESSSTLYHFRFSLRAGKIHPQVRLGVLSFSRWTMAKISVTSMTLYRHQSPLKFRARDDKYMNVNVFVSSLHTSEFAPRNLVV